MDDTAVAGTYASPSDRSIAPDAGASLAGVALVAAVLLLTNDVLDDLTVAAAGVAVAGVMLAAFFGRRYDLLDRRLAAPLAAVAGVAVVGLGGYALVAGSSGNPLPFGLSSLGIGAVGTLVGGVGGVLAALADWQAIPDSRLAKMVRTTVVSTGVGLFGYLVLNVASLLVAVLLLATVWPELTPMRQQLVGAFGLGLGTAATALAYLRLSDRDLDFIDVRTPSLRDAGLAVAGVFVIFGGLIGLSLLFQYLGVPSSSHSTVEQARQGNPEILLLLIPASFLVIGPGEELLFRNIVQKSLYDVFSRPSAIVVASFVFSIVHFSAYGGGSMVETLGSLATIFTLSIVLGAFYAMSDNILVPAFIHGALNAIQFATLYVEITGAAPALV
ncbi:CPBP family intramembrane metalloprotease [Halostella sp. JP-L12]|uniref:CPBP family intramembrane glutamic endopeptidase n=1 Tax=Halostella TaxID=1843185 RepID=UPI000EF76835|nr:MULTISPECIES: CPBP family intramembrane glutamic endopeptidase [Halostella]NHN46939.1 CPBP family intramembrane metalloprotease [Halostella sp. JP-L12]